MPGARRLLRSKTRSVRGSEDVSLRARFKTINLKHHELPYRPSGPRPGLIAVEVLFRPGQLIDCRRPIKRFVLGVAERQRPRGEQA